MLLLVGVHSWQTTQLVVQPRQRQQRSIKRSSLAHTVDSEFDFQRMHALSLSTAFMSAGFPLSHEVVSAVDREDTSSEDEDDEEEDEEEEEEEEEEDEEDDEEAESGERGTASLEKNIVCFFCANQIGGSGYQESSNAGSQQSNATTSSR